MLRSFIYMTAALVAHVPIATTAQTQGMPCAIDFGWLANERSAVFAHETPPPPNAHVGLHGQLLFGESSVYLGHLPFLLDNPLRHPHNFQVLLRVAFTDESDRAAYLDRRATAPEALFTAVPDPFDQDDLKRIREEGLQGESLGEVALFDEHFENRPEPSPFLVADLALEEVVAFRELDPKGEVGDMLSYLILDDGVEAYLVHYLTSPPDFDQVLKVSLAPDFSGAPRKSLDGGILTLNDTENAEAERLAFGDELSCSAHDGTRMMPFDVTVTVEREVYCEAGELSDVAGGGAFEGKRACGRGG